MYRVRFTANAVKQLKKLDQATSALILGWIRKNVEGCDDPRIQGKRLSADRRGQWRYRVGNYRIIVEIVDRDVLILAVNVGRRC